MFNTRPIEDRNLNAAMDEVRAILKRRKLTGAYMIVAPEEAAYGYQMHAPWSALRPDDSTPMGFRFRAKTVEDGKELTEKRVEGAMHTICQLADFASQTQDWMEQLKSMLRNAGIDFTHTPFGGRPLPSIEPRDGSR